MGDNAHLWPYEAFRGTVKDPEFPGQKRGKHEFPLLKRTRGALWVLLMVKGRQSLNVVVTKDGLGAANSRSEVGNAHGNKKGSYTIADIDGRARRVDYVAVGHGFRVTVKTNKPGTAASAPAEALIASPYARPVAPVVNHVAPAIAAPVALAAPDVYGGVLGHGAALGLAAPAALAYGGALGLGHGALGLGLAAPAGLANGAPVGLGHGLGFGKTLLH
ncbi:adult-specific rigid cuticular protein 15.7 [Trichonephila clavipes]|nr:adult-specific rigid cuticular protein 15.7 [Trichonephila clavipes]